MFFLPFDIPPAKEPMNLSDQVILVGSCFSENMADRLKRHKISVLTNPLGTLYNPLSIHRSLVPDFKFVEDRCLPGQPTLHFDAHSAVSAPDSKELLNLLAQKQETTREWISQARWIIITYGTAWVYRRKADDRVVANCHKSPMKEFDKQLLTTDSILEDFKSLQVTLSALNPDLRFLFTVSPVRHIRDGLVENNRSKARLITAVHAIVEEYTCCHYFPAYELLIDQLRDYRFYGSDLVHPSDQAIEFIWEQFRKTHFDKETQAFFEEWSGILQAINHRPFHPDSKAHQKFLISTIKKLEGLRYKVDVATEIETLSRQLV